MPATYPADQQAARTIENAIREAVDRCERPPIELKWLWALPKRIRRSARLLKAAQSKSQVLLKHIRADWTRVQIAERKREARLAQVKAQPRNLECLRAPDPMAWNGLGRQKKRCRAFETVGRAYTTRQQVSKGVATTLPPSADVHALDSSSFTVPIRPSTPLGLRVFICNVPGLLERANGPADGCDYGWPSPQDPNPPSTPFSTRSDIISPSPPAPTPIPPPDFPISPQPGEFAVQGHDIDPDVAYVVAHGRYARAPLAGYSAQRAAVDVYSVDSRFSGAFNYLAQLLFPAGVSQWRQMVNSAGMEPLLDFMHGWYDLSRLARECAR